MQTLLSSLTPDMVRPNPYAHLVKDEILAPDHYAKLALAFPQLDRFTRGLDQIDSNQAIRIRAVDIIDNDEFSSEWREFFRYHTS
jgi:hypothetical protein